MEEKEKQNYKTEAAELIIEAVKFATVAGVNATDCGIRLSASLYLNIRDAMFHYKAMCDCAKSDEDGMLKHYFNLKEHLIRGEKDAVIMQAQAISDAIFAVMQQSDFYEIFNEDDRKELQICNHGIKNIILETRIAGSRLGEERYSVEDAWTDVSNFTIKVVKVFRSKNVSLF